MMRQPRVLYMHGLESGPQGRKARDLGKVFDVYAPDMHVSMSDFSKGNSIARNILRTSALRFYFLGTAGLVAAVVTGAISWAWTTLLVAVTVAGLLTATVAFRQALDLSLMGCIAIQQDAIKTFKPDMIVGSSWGGAVASMLLHQGALQGLPVLLLAPAGGKFMRYAGRTKQWLAAIAKPLPSDQRVWILHGDGDDIVSARLQ